MTKLISLFLVCLTAAQGFAMNIPDEKRTGGFAVGCQAYSFRLFTALEAIEKTAEAGGDFIEFYPGQRFGPDHGDQRWDHHASDEMIAIVEEHLERFDVQAINYGVVGISENEVEARKVFDFAKRLGIQAITTESLEALDVIEKLVAEYDIAVAVHNHPKREDDPSYKLWNPEYLREQLEGRDPRIGACADTGHWMTSGLDPIECLKILDGRIISLHLKDRNKPQGHDVVFGTGVGDIGAVLEELKRQDFDGNISVEYEHNWEKSVPEIAESIGFIRGYGTARGWAE